MMIAKMMRLIASILIRRRLSLLKDFQEYNENIQHRFWFGDGWVYFKIFRNMMKTFSIDFDSETVDVRFPSIGIQSGIWWNIQNWFWFGDGRVYFKIFHLLKLIMNMLKNTALILIWRQSSVFEEILNPWCLLPFLQHFWLVINYMTSVFW